MGDLIQIRGFELLLFCGVLPEEQQRIQPFRFDIDLEVDMAASSVSDELDDTVSYAEVMDNLADALGSERFALLERLAGRTAELILDNQLVLAVTVEVAKLRPPVPHAVDTTGVRIHRTR
jgi:FolB domain-containing protein